MSITSKRTEADLEQQRWQDTLEALEDIRMGRVIDGDKVHAWLKNWGMKKIALPKNKYMIPKPFRKKK